MTCTFEYPRTRLPPEGRYPAPTASAPLIPPVSADKAVRTSTQPPGVLVLSETQGLFLGTLISLEGRSVTLSPCCRLRPPDDAEIPYLIYGVGIHYELPHQLDTQKLVLLDVMAVRYLAI